MQKPIRWRPVDLKDIGFDLENGKKPIIEGPGPFVDLNGLRNISGNTVIRKWKSRLFDLFFIFFSLILLRNSRWIKSPRFDTDLYNHYQYILKTEPIDKIAFIILLLFIGTYLSYVIICSLINKTKYSLKNGVMLVERGPLPWFPRKLVIPMSSIKQIYVEEYTWAAQTYRDHTSPIWHNQPRIVFSFRIMAQTYNGEDICIDKGFSDYFSARILEQWFEEKLSIQDKIVTGEVGA